MSTLSLRSFGVASIIKSFTVGNDQSHDNKNATGNKSNYAEFPSKSQSQPPGNPMPSKMNSVTKKCRKTGPDGSVTGVNIEKPDILSKKQVPCLTAF